MWAALLFIELDGLPLPTNTIAAPTIVTGPRITREWQLQCGSNSKDKKSLIIRSYRPCHTHILGYGDPFDFCLSLSYKHSDPFAFCLPSLFIGVYKNLQPSPSLYQSCHTFPITIWNNTPIKGL